MISVRLNRKQKKHRDLNSPTERGTDSEDASVLSNLAIQKTQAPMRPKLKTTRDGRYFLALTVFVGVAAVNTANNHLFLILGVLLALIIVSGVMSDMTIRNIVVTRRLPIRAQVGRSHLVEIEIRNQKRRIPSYSIEVEDLRKGFHADKRCFFLKIGPHSVQVAAYHRKPHHRGVDIHTGFRIATRFPFGLFEKSLQQEHYAELIVYPAIGRVRERPTNDGRASESYRGANHRHGAEIVGLRPMREGEDTKDIYWKKSTLPHQIVLKDRAKELDQNTNLILDDIRPTDAEPNAWNDNFESRISKIASLAVEYLQRGANVELKTTSGRLARASATNGPEPILRFLALISAVNESSLDTLPTTSKATVHPNAIESASQNRERTVSTRDESTVDAANSVNSSQKAAFSSDNSANTAVT